MGSWQLEVFRMALYVAFPVAIFHVFNHPDYFAKWAEEERKEYTSHVDPEAKQKLLEFIEAYKEEARKKQLEEMEREFKTSKTNL